VMEARADHLERDVADWKSEVRAIRTDITGLRADIAGLRADVARIEGKLSNMPTTWHLVALIFVILAGSFAIIRFRLGP
jgi:hypothetical protein